MRSSVKLPARVLSRVAPRQLFQPRTRCLAPRWSSTSSSNEGRKWSTPLAKTLTEAITTTGPVPVAAYMRQALTAPDGGYYTSRSEGGDQFGQKGDFITSPEISQIFGELVGLWFVAEWMVQGRKSSGVQLVEVGPGRGTLMDDMLRAIRNFKSMASAIETVYLIEASPTLRATQHKLLCGEAPLKETDIGHESTSKYSNLKIVWSEDIRLLPKDATKTPFIVAHEFFDALPIHIFESAAPPPASATPTPNPPADLTNPASVAAAAARRQSQRQQKTNEWRELLVSPVPPNSTHASLNTPLSLRDASPVPDFQLIQSKGPTPHSMYLPHTSPRYAQLLRTPGSVIEISPESLAYATDFATRIGGAPVTPQKQSLGSAPPDPDTTPSTKPTPSGAALILDYGPLDTVPTNSLRGIWRHRAVSPFAAPGQVDVSADVDFVALAEAAINASPGVEVHGPVEQATWLETMGVRERARMLAKRAEKKASEGDAAAAEFKKRIEKGVQRLVDRGPNGMGKLYKALAIVPHFPSKPGRRPVGFGGDVKL
ncbi:S-adenosyl-L-methionine-dependent methyltransferase [Macrophomina phaseolina]|uniref:Protein arginine methyltransferase NDUFAF7 n=1 Tax=Macrophomina phaseolina TaxID=35725 RepID=A0ABQ8FZJ2_9PEZI|nr:S-adenosyl-L-methionine-dependent methyltransferase [Macrophomina phaseolina]